jgi:hypothetical protein
MTVSRHRWIFSLGCDPGSALAPAAAAGIAFAAPYLLLLLLLLLLPRCCSMSS